MAPRSKGVRLRAYAPEEGTYPGVPIEVLKQEMFTRPSARYVYRQRFGRAISLDRIEVALRSAHGGNMRSLTDLSRETVETDPHLGAVLNKRFGAVSSLPYEVRPASGHGIDKGRALFYASVVREQINNLKHFRRNLRQLAWALFDGRAALECQWIRVAGPSIPGFGVVRLAVSGIGWIHPRRLSFGPNRELRVTEERLATVGGSFATIGISLDDFPPGKFIQWMPQLFGEYPEREGLAPRCMYWSFFKRYGQRDRMILMELFGKPWRVIEVEEESTAGAEELEDADDAVDGLGASYTARLPRGAKLNVVQPQRTAGNVHKDVIADVDKQISKLVLGQTGTTDGVPAGLNSNQASVMQDEQLMILTSDAAELSEVIETQLTDVIIAVNFGSEALPHAPRFVLRSDLPADRSAEIERLKGALDAGLEVAMSEAYEISGFRVPEREEAIIRMDQPPTPPLAPTPPAARPVIVYPEGTSPPAGEQQPSTPQAGVGEGGRPDTGISVGSADQASIMTVNEARAGQGLPPLTLPNGQPDPDGDLTINEFNAKRNGQAEPAQPAEGGAQPRIAEPPGAEMSVQCTIRQTGGRWCVYSEDGTRSFGCYDTKEEAEERLRQVEAFKHMALRHYGLGAEDTIALLARTTTAEITLGLDLAAVARFQHEIDCGSVCCARQPETVNGSVEDLLERGTGEVQRAVKKWADAFVEAVDDQTEVQGVINAANRAREALDLQPFARALERRLVHSLALGALDSWFDDEEDATVEPVAFADVNPRFTKMRFDEAMRYFKGKNVMTRAAFDRLSAVAKQKAFTVAALSSDQMLNLVHAELSRQIAVGADVRSFAKFFEERLKLAGFVAPTPKAQASYVQMVFRTNTLGAYNAGRHARMSQPEVMRARPYWQIRTISDDRRRPTHAQADGVVLRANDPFWQRAYPPFGFNCFLPGTVVEGRVQGGSKSFYAGQVVELTTAVGRRLTVTANHPVLTARGLVPAQSIVQGEYLVCDGREPRVGSLSLSPEWNKQQAPAAVEDVFDAFAQLGSSNLSSYRPDDFHGEASRFDGDVEVVGSYRELLRRQYAAAAQKVADIVLESAEPGETLLVRIGLFEFGFQRDGAADSGGPGSRALPLGSSFGSSDGSPLHSLSLGLPSEFDAVLGQNTADNLSADAALVGQLLHGCSGKVQLDKVVSIGKRDFAGHVFDLESPLGWVATNGVYTSNCRCRVVSLSETQAQGLTISVGATITYLPDPGFVSGSPSLLAAMWPAQVLLALQPGDVHEPSELVIAERAVQTLIFDKDQFETREEALNWARDHDFEHDTSRETEDSWRVRQRPPEDFKSDTLRTKEIAPGVSIVDGELVD